MSWKNSFISELLKYIAHGGGTTDNAKQEIEALMDYGLTATQAKVYLSLIDFKSATAKDVYMTAIVSRQDVYKILSDLQEMGLAERVLSSPLKFRATPVNDALTILRQHRLNKNVSLDKRATTIFDQPKYQNREHKDSNETVFEVRAVSYCDPRVYRAFEKVRHSIKFIGCKFSWSIAYSFSDASHSAVRRGIKRQSLLNADATEVPDFYKNTVSEIRIDRSLRCANMYIFDEKEIAIWEENTDARSANVLWSNHRGLINALTDYFEGRWNTATPL